MTSSLIDQVTFGPLPWLLLVAGGVWMVAVRYRGERRLERARERLDQAGAFTSDGVREGLAAADERRAAAETGPRRDVPAWHEADPVRVVPLSAGRRARRRTRGF